MPAPSLALSALPALSTDAELLVLGVMKSDDGPVLLSTDPAFASIAAALPQIGATGSTDELRRLPAVEGSAAPIALIGLGSDVTPDTLRGAAGAAARQLTGIARLAIALPVTSTADASAVLEGAGIGAYLYSEYRSATLGASKSPATAVTVHVPAEFADDAAVVRASAVVAAVHSVRDLVNTPPSDLYPESLAEAAVELAAGLPVEVEVLDVAALQAGGFGGILGVGQGSSRGPRLVVVRYSPTGASTHLALVGKGITFDSGGLSLKPPASMVGMKYDMTGSATVLAATLAAARLGLPVRITAWMCLAENLPSGTALRPNDVLRIRGGKTVEVLNTDAEGRLVLADGLVAASEERPDAIVDVATLTGGARVAMGERFVPIMGDDALVGRTLAAGTAAGEPMWHMPLPPELRSVLDSDIADIANARVGNPAGGMLVAAHFLKYFVGNVSDEKNAAQIPWVHLDIAGAANNPGGPHGEIGKGPTGVAVRTLIALAEDFSRP
ncbi:leucyl aminopeptidase [Lysinimonas soli]|uniref:Probable cytosol aminopeptidase n=1 Tax=Lysinimonas soli TaxID=1074233 RepID=A0ABW0NR35_9MICO